MLRTQRWASPQFHLGLSTLGDSQWMWHPDNHSKELLQQLSYFIFWEMSHYVAQACLKFTTLLLQPLKWQIKGCCIATTESNTYQISFQIDFYQIKDVSMIKSLLFFFFLHFWKKNVEFALNLPSFPYTVTEDNTQRFIGWFSLEPSCLPCVARPSMVNQTCKSHLKASLLQEWNQHGIDWHKTQKCSFME